MNQVTNIKGGIMKEITESFEWRNLKELLERVDDDSVDSPAPGELEEAILALAGLPGGSLKEVQNVAKIK